MGGACPGFTRAFAGTVAHVTEEISVWPVRRALARAANVTLPAGVRAAAVARAGGDSRAAAHEVARASTTRHRDRTALSDTRRLARRGNRRDVLAREPGRPARHDETAHSRPLR